MSSTHPVGTVRRRLAPATLDELAQPYQDLLYDLVRHTVSENTLKTQEADTRYLVAWKRISVGSDLVFPEAETVVCQYILDHSADLPALPSDHPSRITAAALFDLRLRLTPDTQHNPQTVLRRLSTWRRLHSLQRQKGPFDEPAVRTLIKGMRSAWRAANPHKPKMSPNPIDRSLLERLVAATAPGLHGLRDRAILEVAWTSGGRRSVEISQLTMEDLDFRHFETEGVIYLNLKRTKTHIKKAPPPLLVEDVSAVALDRWIRAAGIKSGPVFRSMSRARLNGDAQVKDTALTTKGIRDVLRRLCLAAGLTEDEFAPPHGIRSGFITQALKDGLPLEAVMRASLHRSREQAASYYQDNSLLSSPTRGLRRPRPS